MKKEDWIERYPAASFSFYEDSEDIEFMLPQQPIADWEIDVSLNKVMILLDGY